MSAKNNDFSGTVDESPPRELEAGDLEKSRDVEEQQVNHLRVEDRLARKLSARQVQMIAIGTTCVLRS